MERKWWTLLVVCVGTFMLLLDITIVNVALPKIASDLHASFSDIQWVIDAYALTLASVLLTAGALADLTGRRRMYAIGLALFSLASLLCALSPSSLFLIIARGGQGIGGAIMFATALALLAQEFHGRERGTAFGIWGATISAAAAIGPLLGGVLTQAFGWSSIFYINVPIGIAAAILTVTKLAESRDPSQSRLGPIVRPDSDPPPARRRPCHGGPGAAPDAGFDSHVQLDGAAPGVHHRGRRGRVRQSRAGGCRDRGRSAAAQRDGVRNQQHVSPGGDRDRYRGARCDLREQDLPRARAEVGGDAGGRPRFAGRARGRCGRHSAGARGDPAARPSPGLGRDPRRVHGRDERDPPGRRGHRSRRRDPRRGAGPRPGLRDLRRPRARRCGRPRIGAAAPPAATWRWIRAEGNDEAAGL